MIVAIKAAKWGDVDSLETLLGFDEFEYLALFPLAGHRRSGPAFAGCAHQSMAGTSAEIKALGARSSAAVHPRGAAAHLTRGHMQCV